MMLARIEHGLQSPTVDLRCPKCEHVQKVLTEDQIQIEKAGWLKANSDRRSRATSPGGTFSTCRAARGGALAVFRLITSLDLRDCCTGRSAGRIQNRNWCALGRERIQRYREKRLPELLVLHSTPENNCRHDGVLRAVHSYPRAHLSNMKEAANSGRPGNVP